MTTLVTKDAKGKIRVAEIDYSWNEEVHGYIIKRTTYQLGGKRTQQPDIIVDKGKAKRTVTEQAQLQVNSKIKEYKDKGYKELEKGIECYELEELYSILGEVVLGSEGVPKPMLAKQYEKVTNPKTFDKEYYGSRKIDGLRCLIYSDSKGELHTAARGSGNYDAAMMEILDNETLKEIFSKNPGLILDGECYKLGLSLADINSYARTQKVAKDYSVLQYYWYDIVDLNKTFEERLEVINGIAKEYNLTFEPERTFDYGELRVQVVPHVSISGFSNMEELHNEYVSEGWEGLVVRLKDAYYKPNGRSNDMIKIKKYSDGEFIITGYELGLRGTEDMVFTLLTPEGKEFKAKPHGDRELKQWYVDNFDTECLNKLATVKYFYYSEDGIPLQPSVSQVRLEQDI